MKLSQILPEYTIRTRKGSGIFINKNIIHLVKKGFQQACHFGKFFKKNRSFPKRFQKELLNVEFQGYSLK